MAELTIEELQRILALFAHDNTELKRQLQLEREHNRQILAWRERAVSKGMGASNREAGTEEEG